MTHRASSEPKARGLYAITPEDLRGAALREAVRAALRGGARMVQYREKSRDEGRRHEEAAALLSLCHEYDARLIINDDVDLALAVGADGVHVGRDDPTLTEARAKLGQSAIIGVSCYNDLALARSASVSGATYVAFGSFFPSPTKPGAVRADVDLIRSAKHAFQVEVAAIGGITASNAAALVEAGADWLAVVSGVFEGSDITEAARSLATLFDG